MVQGITYADKQPSTDPVIVTPGVTDNWRAVDSNEVKTVINNHKTYLNQLDTLVVQDYETIFLSGLTF